MAMNLDALDKMSTAALSEIQERVTRILHNRSSGAMRVGRVGWFLDNNGNKRFMRIERINSKTIGGREVDAIHHHPLSAFGGKWRVSPNLLTMIDTGPAPAVRPAVVHDYTPKTSLGAEW
jgi:hypothetical protein